MGGTDLVAIWDVRLSDGIHRIRFDHGTTTGRRVVCVDGTEVLRREWMFRLVGSESFSIGKANCVVRIEPVGGFAYEYSLDINGKSYQRFRETQSKILCTWLVAFKSSPAQDDDENEFEGEAEAEVARVVLEKDTLDLWVDGEKVDATGEFVDGGTETHFCLRGRSAVVKAVSSGSRREGIVHTLIVEGKIVPEAIE